MTSKTRKKTKRPLIREILETGIKEDLVRTEEETNRTQVIAPGSNESKADTCCAGSIVITRSNQTGEEFEVLQQGVYDAIENGLKKNSSGFEDKQANATDVIRNLHNSALTENLRSNNPANNGGEPCGFKANNDVVANLSNMTSSYLNFSDCPILSWRVSEIILETSPKSAADNCHN